MTVCAVKGCHNQSEKHKKDSEVTFHVFPSDPLIAALWIEKIRLNRNDGTWKPTKYTKICSAHFNIDEKYITQRGLCKIRHGAVPTKGLHIFCKDERQACNHGCHQDLMDLHDHDLSQSQLVQKRAALTTGTSVNTVKRILCEAKKSDSDFRTPGKKRPRKRPVTDIDSFDYGVIKRCVHNFHVTDYEFPSMTKLRAKLFIDINFQGSARSLSRIIRNQGFQWKKAENNRRVLIEKSEIRYKRIHYLEKLNSFRHQGRPVTYTYETYVHALIQPSANSSESLLVAKKSHPSDRRVFILHAGSEAGFVPNSLLMFESKSKSSKTGDTHGDMNITNYEKWMRTQLLPNIPPNSVVVVGNASYHNKLCETGPSCDSKRSVMEAWLTERKIDFNQNMLKPQIYNLIKLHKDQDKKYRIDQLFCEHGHDVLRLPPYHPDLNPIEMVWSTIKAYVNRGDVEWNDSKSVMDVMHEKVIDMGPKYDWATLSVKLKEIEDSYIKSDQVIDQMTELFPIIGGDISDSSSDSGDTEYSTSSSEDDNVPDIKRRCNDFVYIEVPSVSQTQIQPEDSKPTVVKKEIDSS